MSFARHDRRHARVPDGRCRTRLCSLVAGRRIEKLETVRDRIVRVARFDGARIGRVHPGQLAVAVAHPDGTRDGVEHAAQSVEFGLHFGMTFAQPDEFQAVARNVAQTHHGAPAHGPSVRFEMAAGLAQEREAEAFAAAAQPLDAMFEFLRRRGGEPRAEAENAARHRRIDDERKIALDFRLARRRCPGNDDLGLDGEEDIGAVETGAHLGEFGDQGVLALRPAVAPGKMQAER